MRPVGQTPSSHHLVIVRSQLRSEGYVGISSGESHLFFRFVKSVGSTDTVSARKFLEAAKSTEDKNIFYTVFKFFEQRNIRLRAEAKFPAGINI